MFCNRCGEKKSQNAKFCSNCGAKLEIMEKDVPDVLLNNSVQCELEVQDIIRNIDEVLPIYRTIAGLGNQIEYLSKQKALVGTSAHRGSFLPLVFGICALSVIWMFLNFLLIIALSSYGHTILIYLFNFVIILLILVSCISRNSFKKKKLQKQIDLRKAELESYKREHNVETLYFLPENYRYFMAASYIKEYLENRRAKDLPEALNLYEEQLYRWKMENYQQQILQVSIQQLYLISDRKW